MTSNKGVYLLHEVEQKGLQLTVEDMVHGNAKPSRGVECGPGVET